MRVTIRARKHNRSVPFLVQSMFLNDQFIRERMAIESLVSGYATGAHVDDVLMAIHVLRFGGVLQKDESAKNAGVFAEIAMRNITIRYGDTGRYGATGDEIRALRMFQDFQEDWWKLQGGTVRSQAIECVDKWHAQIRADRAKRRDAT